MAPREVPREASPRRREAFPALLATAGLLVAAAAISDHDLRTGLARRLAPPPAPGRFGGPLVPNPIVSRGKKVASDPPGGGVLVDGAYRADSWHGGFPTPQKPAWAAIRIGRGYERLLVAWTSSHNHDWDLGFYGAPADYRIETSADSDDGRDGTWRVAVEVAGNEVRTRAHAVDFRGQRWVRLAVTRLPEKVNEWGLHLDEIDVHDLSAGGTDVWVFLGDSITAGVFDRLPAHRPAFADWVSRRHPGYYPAMIEAGKGALHTRDALPWLERVLQLCPDARVVAVGLGSNDGDPAEFRVHLRALVRRIREAGRIPVVARIPFRSDSAVDYPAMLNAVVDAVTREEGILPGPDLYGWFRARPGRLGDHLHPDAAGSVEMNRLWAEAVDPLYPPDP